MLTLVYGAPGAIRTPDPLVRSQVLYPTELRAPKKIYHANDHLTASHLDKLIVQNCYGIKMMVYPSIMWGPCNIE